MSSKTVFDKIGIDFIFIDNLGCFVKIKRAHKGKIAFMGPIQRCAYQHSQQDGFSTGQDRTFIQIRFR